MNFNEILRRFHPTRTDDTTPSVADHWHMAASSYHSVGSRAFERIVYARLCSEKTIETLANDIGKSVRTVTAWGSGDELPAPGAAAWAMLGNGLKVNHAWLEHGSERNGSEIIAPPWLHDAIRIVSRVVSGGTLTENEDTKAAREANAKVLATFVLIPVPLGELTAVQRALSPAGQDNLMQYRTTGQILRADEIAQYRLRKSTG